MSLCYNKLIEHTSAWFLDREIYQLVLYIYCRVVESKNSTFQVGDYVVGAFGWRTLTISNGKQVTKLDRKLYTDQKLSTAIGILGMPG